MRNMSEEQLTKLSIQELIAVAMELREENARLAAQNAELKRRLEEKERSEKRQAAPFSKGEKKANPKKPGANQARVSSAAAVLRPRKRSRTESKCHSKGIAVRFAGVPTLERCVSNAPSAPTFSSQRNRK